MPAPLGIDLAGVDDVDLFLNSTPNGARAAAEAVARSLTHAQGKLWWAPESGYDVTRHLHGFFSAERVQRAVQQQCEKDERVLSADVRADQLGDQLLLTISLKLTTNPADVKLTLTVDAFGTLLAAQISGA